MFLFLHRLPGWLRIMLGDDDHQDVHALAVKADKLQALYRHLQHGAVSAVEDGDGVVNAVKGGGFKKGRGGNNNSRERGGSRPAKSGAAPSTAAAAAEASTSPAGPGSGFSGAVLLPLDVRGQGQPLQEAL